MLKPAYKLTILLLCALFQSIAHADLNPKHEVDLYISKNKGPLIEAIENGDLDTAINIIKSGKVDINTTTTRGATALMYASVSGNTKIMRTLIDAGANIHLKTTLGNTALTYALSSGDRAYESCKMLLDADRDISSSFALSITSAVNSNIPDLVELFLDHGADINEKDRVNRTGLDIAIIRGQPIIARLLIRKGVNTSSLQKKNFYIDPKYKPYPINSGRFESYYIANRIKEGKLPLDANKLDYKSTLDLLYHDGTLNLQYESKDIKHLFESYDKEQLGKLRNAIFARRNYIFKSEDLQTYYTEKFPDYRPAARKVKLSFSEKDNVGFILSIENKK